MDRDRATYEAYDGVRLELLNGAVAECAPLTVKEAVHFLRVLEGFKARTPGAFDALMSEFPARVGLTEQRLADIGLEVEDQSGNPLEFGDLTYADAVKIAEKVAAACYDPDPAAMSRAQIDVLDEIPGTLGVEGPAADVFAVARRFTEAFYLLIYGMARDFCGHLTASPPVKVYSLQGHASQTKGSTT